LVNVRIRGIYTTALTKLLLENGFQIAQPSTATRERFGLPEKPEDNLPFDLDVYDRLDRQGVNAIGGQESLKAFAQALWSTLDDAVLRRRFSMYDETASQIGLMDFGGAPREALTKQPYASVRKTRLNVEFPGLSKTKLDGLRASVTPTLEGHHFFKACGGRVSYLLEMAEKMLEKDCARREVESLFKETIESEFPREGSRINMEHVKIDGRRFDLGVARVTESDSGNGRIRLLRRLVNKGLYDGLEISKDAGDYAVTVMKLGEWSFRTRYFSNEGGYKGTYVNMNTPVELYPSKIRYVDLEADVLLWPDGKIRTVDREKLDAMIGEGYVSRKLGQIVDEKIDEILGSLSLDDERNSSEAG